MKKIGIMLFALAVVSFLFLMQVSAAETQELTTDTTILSKQIPLPSSIQTTTSILFNLPADTPLTIQSGSFLLVLFLIVFFIVDSAISMISLFDGKIYSKIASVAVTLLVCISGGLYHSFIFLMSIGNLFTFTGDSPGLLFFIPLGLTIFFSIIVLFVLEAVKKITSKEQARAVGFNIGKDIAETKIYSAINKK